LAKEAAKAAAEIHLEEMCPRRGLGGPLVKNQVYNAGSSHILQSQKFIQNIMCEQIRVANLFPDEKLKFGI